MNPSLNLIGAGLEPTTIVSTGALTTSLRVGLSIRIYFFGKFTIVNIDDWLEPMLKVTIG